MRAIISRPLNVVSTNVPETETVWAAGTTYAIGAIVRHNHRVYHSLVNSNTGNTPSSSPAAWSDTGATNAYAMFDEYANTATERAGGLLVVLGAEMVAGVALFGLIGETVRLTMTHPAEGVVHDELVDLRRFAASGTQNCTSWEEYFFGEEVTIEDFWRILPAYGAGTTLAIEVTDTQGGTCACSNVVLGGMRNLGATQFGLRLDMADYSRKARDDFGRTYLAPGPHARDAEADLVIDADDLDAVFKAFRDLRGRAHAWILENGENPRHEATLIYGFCDGPKLIMPYPNEYHYSCIIKGLI